MGGLGLFSFSNFTNLFRNTHSFENWGIFSVISQFLLGNIRPHDMFRPITHEQKYLMDYNDILPHVPGLFPVRGLRPLWNRFSPAPVPMPVPAEPQPWVFVQHHPEQQHQQVPPPEVPIQLPTPPVQTLQPSAPAPEAEVLQCPVCKALLPPSVNRDEHVNGHFE